MLDLPLGDGRVGAGGAGGHHVEPRHGTAVGIADGRVERHLARGEPPVHVRHFLLLDAEPPGDFGRRRLDAHGREPRFFLVEVEEELALCLRRAELHEAPVVEDESQNVGADPPGRIRRELDAAIRVVALDRLHEADVALLHEVHDVLVGAPVLVGDLDHEPEVRGDEPCGSRDVARADVLDGERVLLVGREQRVALDLAQVLLHRVEACERSSRGGDRGYRLVAFGEAVVDDFPGGLDDLVVAFARAFLVRLFARALFRNVRLAARGRLGFGAPRGGARGRLAFRRFLGFGLRLRLRLGAGRTFRGAHDGFSVGTYIAFRRQGSACAVRGGTKGGPGAAERCKRGA